MAARREVGTGRGRILRGPRAAFLAVAAAALAVVPRPAAAQADAEVGPQPGSVGFHASAGVVLPSGELAGALDPGATLGGGVAYYVNRHLGVWGQADVQFLSGATDGAGNTFPDMRAFHAGVGGELNLFGGYDLRDDPDPTPVTAAFRVGIGLSRLDTENSLDGGAPTAVDYEHTHLSFRGGATAGYQFAPRVAAFVGSSVRLILTDLEDTRVLADHSPAVDVFDTAWLVPIGAGVRVTLR